MGSNKEKEKLALKALAGLAIFTFFRLYWKASTPKQKLNIIIFWSVLFSIGLSIQIIADEGYDINGTIAEIFNIKECYGEQVLLPLFSTFLVFFFYWVTQNIYERFEINFKPNKSQKFWLGWLIFLFVGAPIINLIFVLTGQANPC